MFRSTYSSALLQAIVFNVKEDINLKKDLNIPFACNSSREKQLPIDSGRDFNLLFDTFKSNNCIINNSYQILEFIRHAKCSYRSYSTIKETQTTEAVKQPNSIQFHQIRLLTWCKLPIVSGKHVNKVPEMDNRSSITSCPTIDKKHNLFRCQ